MRSLILMPPVKKGLESIFLRCTCTQELLSLKKGRALFLIILIGGQFDRCALWREIHFAQRGVFMLKQVIE